jgi:hypothetical protein
MPLIGSDSSSTGWKPEGRDGPLGAADGPAVRPYQNKPHVRSALPKAKPAAIAARDRLKAGKRVPQDAAESLKLCKPGVELRNDPAYYVQSGS